MIHMVKGSKVFSIAVGPVYFDKNGNFDLGRMKIQRIYLREGNILYATSFDFLSWY